MKQLFAYLMIGGALSPFTHWFTTYVFSDFEYLKSLVVICSVDTMLGVVKAIKNKNLSSKGFGMVFNKFLIYSCALIASHVLETFQVHGKGFIEFGWMDSVIFSAIIVREAVSIFENIALIEPSLIPNALLKYLKDFDSITGRLKLLHNEKNNDSNAANTDDSSLQQPSEGDK